MRQKSQSVQVYNNLKPLKLQPLDFSLCIYDTVVLRKKFIGIAKRYLYLFPDQIAICKEPKKLLPDRQIPINNETKVSWTYKTQSKTKKDNKVLKSVIFHLVNNQEYEYLGEEKVLRTLKDHVALYVFQTKIQEEYQAETIIDKGSYATVLELVNIYSKKSFAAKCIDQKKILDKHNAPLQLSYEIQTMRLLSAGGHPNILRLHELYIGNQNFYIVMELALGGSLLSVMKRRETLFDRQEIRSIMIQLLDGLCYMHSFDLMHRDLKPENLLFLSKDDLNTLKIADFGLAQSINEYPYIYPKCGTPGFVAPEVLGGTGDDAKYGVECDVFSAGVILYILLTGEPVFDAKDRKELLELNKKCEIDIDKFDSDLVDDQEKDLLRRMLAKQPEKRFTAKQCLEHRFFNNSLPETKFMTEDFCIQESDLDLRIKSFKFKRFMRNKMPCFTKNPFFKLKKEDELRMQQVEQKHKHNNMSMVIRTNLKLDKDSHENLDHINDEICGSFGISKSGLQVVVEEDPKHLS